MLTVLNSKGPLIRPHSDPLKSGFNCELVKIARLNSNKFSYFRPKLGGLNSVVVSISSGLDSRTLLYKTVCVVGVSCSL